MVEGIDSAIMDGEAETTTPEEKRHFNWWRFILWSLVIGVFYFLSMGPVVMMVEKGRINPESKWLVVCAPCGLAYQYTPLRKPLGMYFHLWAPKSFDENGDSSER